MDGTSACGVPETDRRRRRRPTRRPDAATAAAPGRRGSVREVHVVASAATDMRRRRDDNAGMKEPMLTPDTFTATLANGVRVLAVRLPHLETASASVFVRTGSGHESPRENGISHFVEHMAFKGTAERDCQRINLDAERLGAEVNAHTDKDHTAYHMRGLARDAGAFVRMLGDIVQHGTFPEAELERERQVLLHEYVEDDDDPLSTAFKLFDRACWGTHPMAQPVMGTRRNIERFTRAELREYVQRQYSGANVVVGVAGPVDPEAVIDDVQAAFGAMRAGAGNAVQAPAWHGGVRTRRLSGCPQTHVVMGFPIPSLADDPTAGMVAAALFGEGMSSPLMDEIRERRGLVYYAACSADVLDVAGQFVIEASTSAEHVDEFLSEVTRLLRAHAERVDAVGLERARNQLAVRTLRAQEKPFRRLEEAALDLYVQGRVRPRAEVMERVQALGAEGVRGTFEAMLAAGPAVAIAGKVPPGAKDRWQRLAGPTVAVHDEHDDDA
jgi:predicted Zn-dependent peptidase